MLFGVILLMKSIFPAAMRTFVQFGHNHTHRTSLMKLFTMPSDCKYAKKGSLIRTCQATVLAAAKPPPARAVLKGRDFFFFVKDSP